MNKIKLIIVIYTLVVSFTALSHPHLFVDSIAKMNRQASGEYVIKVTWIFDHWHSQGLIMDFDENMNGKMDKTEKQALLKGLKGNLSQYGHFATLKLNGKKSKGKISGNNIDLKFVDINGENGKKEKVPMFHYSYDYSFKSDGPLKSLSLEFYDNTLYSAIASKGNLELDKSIKAKKNQHKKDLCHYIVEFE